MMDDDDEQIRSALDVLLPAPPASEAFWDDLHARLLAAAGEPIVDAMPFRVVELSGAQAEESRRWRVILVAGAIAVVAAGLAWLGSRPSVTPASPTPTPTSAPPSAPTSAPSPVTTSGTVQAGTTTTAASPVPRSSSPITDAHAINLDSWLTGAPAWPTTSTGPFLVFDLTTLPAGWTIDSSGGGTGIPGYTFPQTWSWHATLTSPSGTRYVIELAPSASPFVGPLESAVPIQVRGHDGSGNSTRIVWNETDTVSGTVSALGPDSAPGGSRAVEVALVTGMATKSIDRLPTEETTAVDPIKPADSLLQLQGTINGRHWSARVTTAPPGSIWVSVDSWGGGDGFGSNNQTSSIVNGLQLSVSGVPGGVIVYGAAPSTVAGVRVELSDGVTIDLPVYQWTGGSAFAVPIPDGLDVSKLAYLDVTGTVLHRTLLPEFAIPTVGSSGGQSEFGDVNGTTITGNHTPYDYGPTGNTGNTGNAPQASTGTTKSNT
jgi:hypothetical protein